MKKYFVIILVCLAFFGYVFFQFFAEASKKRADPLTHYDDDAFWKGYETARDGVRDWFNEEYGYYHEIYSDAYFDGYEDGYNEGFENGIDYAIDTVDDWYE